MCVVFTSFTYDARETLPNSDSWMIARSFRGLMCISPEGIFAYEILYLETPSFPDPWDLMNKEGCAIFVIVSFPKAHTEFT